MKNEFCIAAARLIHDTIGADGYVSNRELDILYELLYRKYQLHDLGIYHDAMHNTLCDALNTVRTWPVQEDIDNLIADLKLLAGVGEYGSEVRSITGFCSQKEAWLLTAFTFALRKDSQLFSYGNSDFRFSRSEIIYFENSFHEAFNDEMKEKRELFQAQLNEFGIRLIYIPEVRDYLKRKRKVRKLIKLMRYVNPFNRYEDADAQKIADDIDEIQTADFAADFLSSTDIDQKGENLYEKMRPSFLLKIGTSVVACGNATKDEEQGKGEDRIQEDIMPERRTKKAVFILIPIKESVKETLDEIISIYRSFTLEQSLPLKVLPNEPFVLHGFDRTFLNYVMSRMLTANKLTKVLFDFYNSNKLGKGLTYCVYFTFDHKRTVYIPLSNKPMCLYFLTLLYTNQETMEGVPYRRNPRKRGVEEVLDLIGKKAKAHFRSMYQQEGTLTLELNHLHEKLKNIPAPYHVVRSHDGNHLIANFPYRDVVYIDLDGQERLLWDYIEEIKAKDKKMPIEAICKKMFSK